MKIINASCELVYDVGTDTNFLFQIAVVENEHQHIRSESIQTTPHTELHACRVGLLGNRMYRLLAQPGQLRVEYQATVSLDQRITPEKELQENLHSELPTEVLPFLNPSRYCESDRLFNLAWNEFSHVQSGFTRVQYIANWVHSHLSYVPGSTGPTTTACDVLVQRSGVCRDYAHLSISLCRALGIPARYIAGYAVDLHPPDFHGFFEAYLGNAWYLFDATRLAPLGGFVRIGAGMDAADLSFATVTGFATLLSIDVRASYAQESSYPYAEPDTAIGSS